MNYLEIVAHLIIVRTCVYFQEIGFVGIFERFPRIERLAGNLTNEELSAWAGADEAQTARYRALLSLIGNDSSEDNVLQSVIDLCLAEIYVPEFSAFLKYHIGSSVTLHLAYALEGVSFPEAADIALKIEGISSICYVDRKKSPVCYAELSMDDRVLHYLQANDRIDDALEDVCSIFDGQSGLHPLYVNQELADAGAKFLSMPGRMVQLCGRGGRRFITRHISVRLGRSFLFMSAKDLGVPVGEDFEALKMILMREAMFRDAGICIYGITHALLETFAMDGASYTRRLALPILKNKIPLVFCTDEGMMLAGAFDDRRDREEGLPLGVFELPKTDYAERMQVWQGFAAQYGIEIDSIHFAMRYQLTPSEIAGVIAMWRSQEPQSEAKNLFGFSKLCYEVTSRGMEDKLGKVIYPEIPMADLMVDQSVRDLLGQAIASVNGSHRIFEEWNLKSKYAYGSAVTVLLTGPPGTGKTMSAHAIAHELKIPLYQVNLSNIVDKYIGETEKHLEQAFSFAEKTNMVLFFDEADALFGRRSAVTDAKDKHANTEVSYLLQRIEQFEGIAIMATNLINNIDPAFLRRMKYVIRFQPPDEKQRLAIWKSCILPELPVDDLDLPYLARQFHFSGGTIKNVLLNACSIAIYEEEILGMRHILKAIKDEYIKTERIVDRNTWGEYSYYDV